MSSESDNIGVTPWVVPYRPIIRETRPSAPLRKRNVVVTADNALFSTVGVDITSKLFPELWREIATFLPKSASASLALTNKTMLKRLGAQHLTVLAKKKHLDERIKFLLFFDHQLPNHILCSQHGIYHLRSEIARTGTHGCHRLYLFCQGKKARLSFASVQSACRADRHGTTHGKKVTPYHSGNSYSRPNGWNYNYSSLVTGGRFLVRSRVSLSITSIRSILRTFRPDPSNNLDLLAMDEKFPMCLHLKDELSYLARCAVRHAGFGAHPLDIQQCAHCAATYRCADCATEYAVEIVPHRWFKARPALVITTWMDLGSGRTPRERLWRHATSTREQLQHPVRSYDSDDDDNNDDGGNAGGEGDAAHMFDPREKRSVRFRFETAVNGVAMADWQIRPLTYMRGRLKDTTL
ncbi:MAG: hypothetical protein M1828_003239 [Chrysothrix sp. TS-e1954]|nr:MAG: hypothetical protein M1828_003239 [Chrysothrix sp. TS-e1954]